MTEKIGFGAFELFHPVRPQETSNHQANSPEAETIRACWYTVTPMATKCICDRFIMVFFPKQFPIQSTMFRKSGRRMWRSFMIWHLETKRGGKKLHTLKRAYKVDEHRNQYCLLSDTIERFLCVPLLAVNKQFLIIFLWRLCSFSSFPPFTSPRLTDGITSLLMHRLVKHRWARNGKLLMALGAVKSRPGQCQHCAVI